MRKNTLNTESVFEELSETAATETAGERGHEISPESTANTSGELDDLLAETIDALPVEDVEFEDELVKGNLEELLLVLITLHDGTHGDELLSDLTRHFETTLSPGTVYPALHELEEADLLSMHAKVRTKEYSIADEEAARAAIEQTMIQQLAFGLLLSAFLSRY